MSSKTSTKFLAIYESLPHDEQHTLVENYLAPLLDSTSSSKAASILAAAGSIQKRHVGMPILDLRGKRAELSAMLDTLGKDIKRSFVTESTSRNELLHESVRSLTTWLSDIWTVVYEHQVDFELAHDCLLFVMEKLEQIANLRSGCRCALANMYLPVILRNKSGKKIKTFHVVGTQNLEEVLEYIWRDMFLSMLASDNARYLKLIPHMLRDIESHLSWRNLFKVLYGGKNCSHEDDGEDEEVIDESDDSEQDEERIDESDTVRDEECINGDLLPILTDDEDDEYEDEDDTDYDSDDEDEEMPQRCKHWTTRMYNQVHQLRLLIQEALVSVFEEQPSVPLFISLRNLSFAPEVMKLRLLSKLEPIATSCSDSFATALDIYALEDQAEEIIKLLDSHSHLLRPRDCDSLRAAARTLAREEHHQRALQIMEKELLDTARAIRQALLLPYSQLDLQENKDEILDILKLSRGSLPRRNRVEAWVDAITTPGAEQPNPFMFAAIMMGVPAMPGMNHDDDQYTYLDIDPHDPDLDDLRAEYRPALKHRFESWANFGVTVKGGPDVLLKVYKSVVEMMPFLRASDATEEMIARLQDRTGKRFICEGLDALLAFVKVQRRKLSTRKAELRKKGDATASTAPKPDPAATSSSSPAAMNPPSSTDITSGLTTGAGPSNASASEFGSLQPPSHPTTPSFSTFRWNTIGAASSSMQTGLGHTHPVPPAATVEPEPVEPAAPAPPMTPAAVPVPPQTIAFTPFSFFYTPTPPATTNHNLDEGPPQYGGGIEDVD